MELCRFYFGEWNRNIAIEVYFRELTAKISGLPNIALTATEPLELEDLGNFGQVLLSSPMQYRSISELHDSLQGLAVSGMPA